MTSRLPADPWRASVQLKLPRWLAGNTAVVHATPWENAQATFKSFNNQLIVNIRKDDYGGITGTSRSEYEKWAKVLGQQAMSPPSRSPEWTKPPWRCV